MHLHIWSGPNEHFHLERVKTFRQVWSVPFLCACKGEFAGLRACVTDKAKPAPPRAGWGVSAVILNRMRTGEKHTLRVRSKNNN